MPFAGAWTRYGDPAHAPSRLQSSKVAKGQVPFAVNMNTCPGKPGGWTATLPGGHERGPARPRQEAACQRAKTGPVARGTLPPGATGNGEFARPKVPFSSLRTRARSGAIRPQGYTNFSWTWPIKGSRFARPRSLPPELGATIRMKPKPTMILRLKCRTTRHVVARSLVGPVELDHGD